MKKKAPQCKSIKTILKRDNRIVFTLNEKELNMLRSYLDKNKIENQSRWIREVVMTHLWLKTEEQYPTLFNEHEMRK
jgi:hypothetical protein